MQISVLIVGDVALYRDGLRLALSNREEFSTISTARYVWEVLERVTTIPPDVILLDLATVNALAELRSLAQCAPQTTLVALAVPNAEEDIIACAEAGAAAYVTRDASLDDLVATIQAARQGQLNCSAKVAGALFRRLSAIAPERQSTERYKGLSPRETQVLHLIEKGLSNKEISRSLVIEVATVKNHVHHILEKMNVNRRGEAAAALRQMQ